MSEPLTIKEHIAELMSEDGETSIFFVVFSDPAYGHAMTAQFTKEDDARDYYAEKKQEGRRPRFFMRDISINTYEE